MFCFLPNKEFELEKYCRGKMYEAEIINGTQTSTEEFLLLNITQLKETIQAGGKGKYFIYFQNQRGKNAYMDKTLPSRGTA